MNQRFKSTKTMRERFFEKVNKTDDCWLWTAGTTGAMGYGRFMESKGKLALSHRLSYEMHIGEIPLGMQVMHKCDNPKCVNPAHLVAGTNADNVADKMRKGRHNCKRVTHCTQGHEFTAENTFKTKQNVKVCKICNKARCAAAYLKRKAREAGF